MTSDPPAKVAFVTEPEPKVYMVTYVIEGAEFVRFGISKEQLANIVLDGAMMLLRQRPLPTFEPGE